MLYTETPTPFICRYVFDVPDGDQRSLRMFLCDRALPPPQNPDPPSVRHPQEVPTHPTTGQHLTPNSGHIRELTTDNKGETNVECGNHQ